MSYEPAWVAEQQAREEYGKRAYWQAGKPQAANRPERGVHSPQIAGLQAVGADQVAPPHVHAPRLARLVDAQRLQAGTAGSMAGRASDLVDGRWRQQQQAAAALTAP